MPTLPPPNLFITDSALEPAMAADAAAAPDLTDPPVAVAGLIEEPSVLSAPIESSMSTGGHQEIPAVVPHAAVGVFVLDEAAFMAELADETVRQELAMRMPTFLSAPSQEYLRAIA